MDSRFGNDLVALLPRFRRFARGLTGSVDDADDLVQAACERAVTRFGQWTEGTRLDSWVYRIMQNIFLDERRRVRRHGRHLELVGELEPNALDGERVVEARMTLDAVRHAVEVLPEDQRVMFMLVCVEGYSYKEVSEILSLPMGTVTSRLSRGRTAVCRMIGEGRSASESESGGRVSSAKLD